MSHSINRLFGIQLCCGQCGAHLSEPACANLLCCQYGSANAVKPVWRRQGRITRRPGQFTIGFLLRVTFVCAVCLAGWNWLGLGGFVLVALGTWAANRPRDCIAMLRLLVFRSSQMAFYSLVVFHLLLGILAVLLLAMFLASASNW